MATSIDSELTARLRHIVGDAAVITEDAELRIFSEDALRGRGGIDRPPPTPLVIVRPGSAAEAAAVLALATQSVVPVVTYGAGTGLMGGARTAEAGIVLDTVRLNQISVQAQDRIVWSGSAAILEDVDAALKEHGMGLAHDPWTFPVAAVGVTLSTNGFGYKGGRFGGIGDQAIALELALADG